MSRTAKLAEVNEIVEFKKRDRAMSGNGGPDRE
jgi:hypothetical protein